MISVLRLGHRIKRDPRISTHCGLVARAFGADEIIFSGEKDEKMIKGLRDVTKRWGGSFSVKYEANYRKIIKAYQKKGFLAVHLTMYGLPIENEIRKIRKKKVLVIIGGEKVPGEVYSYADYNIAVTNQPHSEVAALAVFLNSYSNKAKKFSRAKIRVIPQKKGKKVVD